MIEQKTFAERITEAERAAEMLAIMPWNGTLEAIFRDWMVAKTTDARESLWHDVQAVSRIRSKLNQAIQDGKAAAMDQERANRPSPAMHRAAARDKYASKLGVDLNG